MAEKSNKELVIEFFDLMTNGFFISGDLVDDAEKQTSEVLQMTKTWRRELWRKFFEIEDRLCPRPSSAPRPDYYQMMLDKAQKSNAGAARTQKR
jgi:hypothetical protein